MLVSVLSLLLVIAWLARLDIDKRHAYYDIYFEDSVAGLGVGGDVRYRGIRIGRVARIGIAHDDPRKVQVTAEVIGGPVLRVGDEAELKLQGLTGVAFVNIQGAGPDSPPLGPQPHQPYPVIPSRQSQIAQLFASAPELISRGIQIADQLNELLNAENRAQLNGMLADLRAVSATLAGERERISSVLVEFERSGAAMRSAAGDMSRAAGSADRFFSDGRGTLLATERSLAEVEQILQHDIVAVLKDTRSAIQGVDATTGELNRLIAENRGPLRDFTEDGLGEFVHLASEARGLTRELSRLVERMDREGLGYLVNGDGDDGYQFKEKP